MRTSILLTFSFFLLAFSLSLQAATVNWAAVYSGAAPGDVAPSLAGVGDYSAYCLTVASAEAVFGSAELSAVNSYVKANYSAAKSGVAAYGTALTAGDYSALEGQYGFAKYDGSPVAAGNYLAVLFYDNGTDREFRVYGKDSAIWAEGQLVFDDTENTAYVGDWTAEAVPEPTSGMLLLIGIAGLALTRKRT